MGSRGVILRVLSVCLAVRVGVVGGVVGLPVRTSVGLGGEDVLVLDVGLWRDVGVW